MICYIYRSKAKAEMYLYLKTRDEFSELPEALIKIFGQPEFSMVVDLSKRVRLARVDISKVQQSIKQQGYYLQMPPLIESLLQDHKNIKS